jgi:hypothetical protein
LALSVWDWFRSPQPPAATTLAVDATGLARRDQFMLRRKSGLSHSPQVPLARIPRLDQQRHAHEGGPPRQSCAAVPLIPAATASVLGWDGTGGMQDSGGSRAGRPLAPVFPNGAPKLYRGCGPTTSVNNPCDILSWARLCAAMPII